MIEETFSERMSKSDHVGNIHGMPKTTYYRARAVWRARLSPDPVLATKAQDLIGQLDSNTTTLTRATRLLGLETSSPSEPRVIDTLTYAECATTIQRIAATLDGLAQAAAGIRGLNPTEFTVDEATDLASRITLSCKRISKIAGRLRRIK